MHNLVPRFLLGLSLGALTLVGAAGCHREEPSATNVADNSGPDPADANLAPVDNSQPQSTAAPAPARVLGIRSQAQPQQNAELYAQVPPQQPAPQQTAPPPPDQDQAYQDAQAYEHLDADGQPQPVEYADQPPPELPEYEQPEAPGPNYIWTPGYWC